MGTCTRDQQLVTGRKQDFGGRNSRARIQPYSPANGIRQSTCSIHISALCLSLRNHGGVECASFTPSHLHSDGRKSKLHPSRNLIRSFVNTITVSVIFLEHSLPLRVITLRVGSGCSLMIVAFAKLLLLSMELPPTNTPHQRSWRTILGWLF